MSLSRWWQASDRPKSLPCLDKPVGVEDVVQHISRVTGPMGTVFGTVCFHSARDMRMVHLPCDGKQIVLVS